MTRGGKLENEYTDALGHEFLLATPKAVFAAIAVSSLTCFGEYLDDAKAMLVEEWWCLYQAGIVPQKPSIPRAVERVDEGPVYRATDD